MGLAGATWASRLPQIRDRMDLDAAAVGLLLLLLGVGGLVALPLAGLLVTRVGPRRAVTTVGAFVGAGLAAVSTGFALWPPLLLIGLFVLGTATGFWDVAVAVHAAALERRLGRALMPRFFAGFSLGTVVGACLGALLTALGVTVSLHIGAVALLITVLTPVAVRRFLPRSAPPAWPPRRTTQEPGQRAWRDPRTVVLGLVALAFALAEGAGSNWVSLTVIDRHRTTAAVATLAYAAFLAAVTLGRWLGPLIVGRLGRPGALRASALAACLGVVLFAAGPSLWAGFAGTLLWGAGAALGFPLGLSAGSDDPAQAAARVGVITSIGYCGFVCSPPLFGALADRTGLAPALLVVAAVMAACLPLAGALRDTSRVVYEEATDGVAPGPLH
ncbi:putative major facilitator superfamily MFS-1 (plasmid) [Streptomyces sp. Tu6071]|uniref:MFS transporter n=1 Tax=Streptomyces sp. Tu6071 TaxID=355249 RepID=UPI00020E6BDB|nr:putative major facilitator superfamily MFS-1 [Streptomyces sp. Tu6071]